MKILFLSFFLVPFSFLFAQGNLQFNQVYNLNYSGTQTPTAGVPTVTFQNASISVPAGKVWKIESANVTTQQSISTGYLLHPIVNGGGTFLMLNNIVIANNLGTTMNYDKFTCFPFWLPAGTYPVKLVGQYPNDYGAWTAYSNISVIEFNIIP
jgi:hypothetical protein